MLQIALWYMQFNTYSATYYTFYTVNKIFRERKSFHKQNNLLILHVALLQLHFN